MENVIPHLFVGDDNDYEKIKDKTNWSALRCCKYGPGGHQQTLGYDTLGAPKGANYLSVDALRRRALNYIDVKDPNFIPVSMIEKGLQFIDKRLASGDNVLVACNAGHSRGPTTAMLYLRSIGDLTGNFISSERRFRALYDKYDPGVGTRQFMKTHWDYFDGLYERAAMDKHSAVMEALGAKEQTPKKEIREISIRKSHNGGHIVTHKHHGHQHPDEEHTTHGTDSLMQHVMQHATEPNEGEAADPSMQGAAPMTAAPSPMGSGAPMASPTAQA